MTASTARWIAIAAALALTVVLAYIPGMGGGFVFDDITNIVDNAPLHVTGHSLAEWSAAAFSSPASDLQRPVAMLTFAANHYFTGLDPRAMKVANLAIHLLNTLLVFELSRRLVVNARRPDMGPPRPYDDLVAGFIAACWALNPINVMGVLYIVQRMESLAHVFVFLGLLLYIDGRCRQLSGRRGWGGILGALLIAMPVGALAKESAALLPLYAFCIELCLFRFASPVAGDGKRLKALFVVGLWIPAALALAWLLPRSLRPGAFAGRTFGMAERLLTEVRALVDYLHWTLLPDIKALGLYHDDYPISHGFLDPASTLASFVGLLALLVAAIAARARRPLSALGLLFFFAAHAITASFLSLELVFEHRNYFASFGLMLVLADLTLLWPSRPNMRMYGSIVAVFLLGFYGLGTWARSTEWSNPIGFARTEAVKHPGSPRAQYDLARLLVIQSRYDRKSPYWNEAKQAIAAARAVQGCGVLPAQAELIFSARSKEPTDDSAWQELNAKFRSMPIGPEQLGALAALADCAAKRLCDFPRDRMIGVFNSALARGDNPEILNVYGSYALNVLQDVPFALKLWEEALRLRPSEPQYHVNLVRLHIALGEFGAAEAGIAQLGELGRFGQTGRLAVRLRLELAQARQKQPRSKDP